ncbi:hypothetical protein HPB52_011877 [Rhipicephalus sanguineus]|uniref:Uncharacterized protein n=1 Tax=Rhipicephalus sanguineus TaxID=34632 RepID=A0A9D4T5I8_RHISA|nr:hypothetical protein HPB52_011877 [Rhipicephalus sanguineus]
MEEGYGGIQALFSALRMAVRDRCGPPTDAKAVECRFHCCMREPVKGALDVQEQQHGDLSVAPGVFKGGYHETPPGGTSQESSEGHPGAPEVLPRGNDSRRGRRVAPVPTHAPACIGAHRLPSQCSRRQDPPGAPSQPARVTDGRTVSTLPPDGPGPPVPVTRPPPHHRPPKVHLSLDGATKRRMPAAALQQATTSKL